MHFTAADLLAFYRTPLGKVVRRSLMGHISARWRSQKPSCLIGLGYAIPYLKSLSAANRRGAMMPDHQGALAWPTAGPTQSVLVQEDMLPLADNSVDRLLVVHCLEVAERARPMLREIWRVLAPEGRVLIVVPNRQGVWCRLDRTPFGHGQPFSRRQLENLLIDALFTPIHWSSALYFPPVNRRVVARVAKACERAGSVTGPAFAGVLIVEARKELVGPAAGSKAVSSLRDLVTIRRDQA